MVKQGCAATSPAAARAEWLGSSSAAAAATTMAAAVMTTAATTVTTSTTTATTADAVIREEDEGGTRQQCPSELCRRACVGQRACRTVRLGSRADSTY